MGGEERERGDNEVDIMVGGITVVSSSPWMRYNGGRRAKSAAAISPTRCVGDIELNLSSVLPHAAAIVLTLSTPRLASNL